MPVTVSRSGCAAAGDTARGRVWPPFLKVAKQDKAGRPETRDTVAIEPKDRDRRNPRPETHSELELPFCGDEYPPLKGTLSTMVCTKEPHPATETHLNEATGLGWRDRGAARSPYGPGSAKDQA